MTQILLYSDGTVRHSADTAAKDQTYSGSEKPRTVCIIKVGENMYYFVLIFESLHSSNCEPYDLTTLSFQWDVSTVPST